MTDQANSVRSARPVRSLVSLLAALSVGILGSLQMRQEESRAQQGSSPPKGGDHDFADNAIYPCCGRGSGRSHATPSPSDGAPRLSGST